jgi:hypothetical protein
MVKESKILKSIKKRLSIELTQLPVFECGGVLDEYPDTLISEYEEDKKMRRAIKMIAGRRKVFLDEMEKGNLDKASEVNKETALLKVRESKKAKDGSEK